MILKKSDAYQSGMLEGTTPVYDAYMRLKKNLETSIDKWGAKNELIKI